MRALCGSSGMDLRRSYWPAALIWMGGSGAVCTNLRMVSLADHFLIFIQARKGPGS